ncbi:MAG: energy transducer TonB [Burkholderiales bacterium]|nr:MAG: energy transducer TonB [Burkholderiales bacterium]
MVPSAPAASPTPAPSAPPTSSAAPTSPAPTTAPAQAVPGAAPATPAGGAPGPLASASPDSAPRRTAPRVDASWRGNTPPPYPGAARRMGDQGEVRLDVHVGADGTVLDVRLRQSSGSPLLDRTAIETVRRWRFDPATVDGRPVAAWYHDWRWVFRLDG